MIPIPEFAFQNLLNNISKKSIDETQLERARWRWEFLRLNDDYIKDCSNLKEDIEQLPTHNNYGLSCWINPELTFDEFLKNIADHISDSDYDNIDKDEALGILQFLIWVGHLSMLFFCCVKAMSMLRLAFTFRFQIVKFLNRFLSF